MDKALDEVIASRQRDRRGPPPRRPRAPAYPRDGVRKVRLPSLLLLRNVLKNATNRSARPSSSRERQREYRIEFHSTRDDRANLDNDWVHDRYDDEPSPNRGGHSRGRRRGGEDEYDDRRAPVADNAPLPAKLRVDNLHYDLTEDDIYDLFTRIAPVRDAKLTYDRAGRSEGVAFVTYDHVADARTAIREFDGANAKGQPIRISLLPPPPRSARRDNPFDRVQNPRSLFDRIEPASGRGRRRSASPMDELDGYDRNGSRRQPRGGDRRSDTTKPPPDNIDRYIPGQRGTVRSSSQRDGRRPGERRERRAEPAAPRSGARPKKTAEELDAEMEDYWAGQAAGEGGEQHQKQQPGATTSAGQAATAGGDEDMDMIE